ncbi:MAG: GSU2403 family nucleotidyltransferase fold protein, partial [Nitrososphaerales archaeon]
RYAAWMDAERVLIRGRLAWKTVSGTDYLYRIVNGRGDGRSLGPRSPETETQWEAAQIARQTTDTLWPTLRRDSALYRTLRLPRIAAAAAQLLREFDRYGLLGTSLLVVGTNAMAAYEIEAQSRFASAAGVDSTADFDVTWAAAEPRQTTLAAIGAAPRTLLEVMKRVDATYTINTERTFQVRNANGYEIELLLPKSLEQTLPPNETLRPIALAEQDWLLPGRRVEHVVCGLDGQPCRMIAPDPRYFALHKLWLAQKPSRNPLKRPKDEKQGTLLLSAVAERMPHYALDDAFRDALPPELVPPLDRWRQTAPGEAQAPRRS